MMPFLKGFYLSMNLWRGGRNKEGWKLSAREWVTELQHKLDAREYDTLCGFEEDDDVRTRERRLLLVRIKNLLLK